MEDNESHTPKEVAEIIRVYQEVYERISQIYQTSMENFFSSDWKYLDKKKKLDFMDNAIANCNNCLKKYKEKVSENVDKSLKEEGIEELVKERISEFEHVKKSLSITNHIQ